MATRIVRRRRRKSIEWHMTEWNLVTRHGSRHDAGMNAIFHSIVRLRTGIVTGSLLALAGCLAASDPPIPLSSGDYEFTHRFAEQPGIESMRLNVHVDGAHVIVVNPVASPPFPAGVLDEGTLMWHAATGQWIIGHEESDRTLRDVGACSGGPEVIDLQKRIYWTC